MPIYEQTPIRLQLDLVGAPPVDPIDANTGLPPKCWRGQTIAVDVGIFDAGNVPVDLSNLLYIQLVLQHTQMSLAPLVVKTIDAANISQITTEDWTAGLAQQARFILTAADTDQGLDGQTMDNFWIVVQGKTEDGATIIYSAGQFDIYYSGAYVPAPLAGYISRHRQACVTGNILAVPTSNNHTEVVDFSGVARTSAIILPIAGLADGAILRLILALPSLDGITIPIYSNSLLNPILLTIASAIGKLTAYAEFYYDNDTQAWVLFLKSSESAPEPAVTDSDGNPVTDSDGNPVTTSN